jgi:small-conductance mechanosensitive channel
MTWREVLQFIDALLNHELFTISNTSVTPVTIVIFATVVLLTWWLSAAFQATARRAFRLRGVSDPGVVGVAARLIHYAVMTVGLGIALQTIGFNLGALFAAGAFFAVAIGFAMQNVAQNFVSGVILLAERTIKNDDVLEVEGRVVRVTKMGLRATVARTRDEEDIIIPNSILAQNAVTNYTLRDPVYRLKAFVGVAYGSDMAKVMSTLRTAATGITERMEGRDPQVLLTDFGSHSVNFEVQVWIDDPWRARGALSSLNEAIWWALKDTDITIAFPQVDVHIDPPVMETLRALRPAG